MNNPSATPEAPVVTTTPPLAAVGTQQTCTCTAPAAPAAPKAAGTPPTAGKAARVRKPRGAQIH